MRVSIQIGPHVLSGLIWAQTVCKVYQQITLVGRVKLRMVKTTEWVVKSEFTSTDVCIILTLCLIRSDNFCCLQMIFANSLDQDQAQQNLASDLHPSSVTIWCYSWKSNEVEKYLQTTKKNHEKIPSMHRVNFLRAQQNYMGLWDFGTISHLWGHSLNMHAQLSSGARDLKFGQNLLPSPYCVVLVRVLWCVGSSEPSLLKYEIQ